MKQVYKKTIKVGITKNMERVSLDISLDIEDIKIKTTSGSWVDSCSSLYIWGCIKKNGVISNYGQAIPTIQGMLTNEEFTSLYHTKEYIQTLIDISVKYNLNKYCKMCDHQCDMTLDNSVCPVCGHEKGKTVYKVIPTETLTLILKSDWERRFESFPNQKGVKNNDSKGIPYCII